MEKYTIEDLRQILITLRGENGCPWDKVQTHQSIKKSMIEECYEAIDALDNGSDKDFANELGDVLLQVVFHARLAEERNAFDFDDVVNEICTKLISRHTHVFGEDKAGNEEEALTNWEKNKKKEKNHANDTAVLKDVPLYLPGLMRAEKLYKKAKDFGYEEKTLEDMYQSSEELIELLKSETDIKKAEKIYGEALFYLAAIGKIRGFCGETAISDASNRFIERFADFEDKKIKKDAPNS